MHSILDTQSCVKTPALNNDASNSANLHLNLVMLTIYSTGQMSAVYGKESGQRKEDSRSSHNQGNEGRAEDHILRRGRSGNLFQTCNEFCD